VSEYRTREALPFLTTLLRTADGEIWKTALDGVVVMGDESALTFLVEVSDSLGTEKRSWVEEAIGQIKKGLSNLSPHLPDLSMIPAPAAMSIAPLARFVALMNED
jgi:HEAT repeat protein